MSGVQKYDENGWKVILFEQDPSTTKYEEALVQARQNYMQIFNDGSFLKLEREKLSEILDSDELNVENEEVVFESVKRWLDHNFEYYSEHIKPLLRLVRFSQLPFEYLFDRVEPFVFPFKECRDIYMNALHDRILGKNKVKSATRKYQKNSTTILNYKYAESGRRLLSIGSDRSNTANFIEIYDGSIDQWTKPNELNINRINFSVELIDNKVMLIGGIRSLDESTEPLKTVQSLDLSSGILSLEDSLNDARQYSAAVVFGDGKLSLLYVLGGRGNDEDLDSVERWDPLIREWQRVQPMPSKRIGLAAAVLNGKIYVLGGRIDNIYTNTMEAYNLENAEWKKKASMKEARAHFCVAVFKNFLYAVAGINENQSNLIAVEKYDPFDDFWVTIANIPSIGHVGISFLENRLICAGGKNSTNVFEYNDENDDWSKLRDLHEPRAGNLLQLPKAMNDFKFDWPKHKNDDQKMSSHRLLMLGKLDTKTVVSLEEYNPTKNQWTRLKDLDIGRINYSVAIVGENLLIIGGYLSDFLCHSNEVDSFNLRTGNHSQLAPLNYRRQNSAVAILTQEKLAFVYVIGGMKDEKMLNSVERWDSSLPTWTMVTPMSVARAGHGAVFLKNKIYVVGGKTGKNTYDKTVEAYDYENDNWTPKASMNNPKAYFAITTFKNCIYVAGGYRNATTLVRTVERYDPLEDIWTTIANISSEEMLEMGTNRLIFAGGKSSNLVEEYDESEKKWLEVSPLDTQSSGFLLDLNSDTKKYSGDWIVKKKPSKRLIFLGGWNYEDAKSVETFNVADKKWEKLKDFSIITKRRFFPIIMSNKLLLLGGHDSNINQDGRLVHAIDLSSGTVQSFPSTNVARAYPSSVIVTVGKKTTLYLIGGYQGRSLSSVEKWDPLTKQWTEGTSMTTARFGHGCVFLHEKIYAIGGTNNKILDTVEVFDVKNKKKSWEERASMNHSRYYFGITLYNDQIYVAGGWGTSTVERYDPPTDTWTTLANIQSSGQVGLCTSGYRMICAGGNGNNAEEYVFHENKWISLPPKNMSNQHGFLLELPENAKLGNW